MEYRSLGGTGVKVGHLCLGTVLDGASLDRMNALVPPGANVRHGDRGGISPALAPAARRR